MAPHKKYKQGIYQPINKEKYVGDKLPIYRSGYEMKLCVWLDKTPTVKKWSSESVVIPYVSPLDGRIHRYFVDFVVFIQEGDKLVKYLVEVKPKKETLLPVVNKKKKQSTIIYETATYAKNQAKWSAAKQWAANKGMKFIILTEQELGID